MLRGMVLTLMVVSTVSGCARLADSRLNPFNWFGNSREDVATTDPAELRPLVPENRSVQVVDARPLVTTVTALSVDRSPYGAIVRATGLPPTQGYFNAQLVPRSVENGVLVLEFRAEAPAGYEATGSQRSRAVTAAYVIDAVDLPAIRSVRVLGAENSRTSRR